MKILNSFLNAVNKRYTHLNLYTCSGVYEEFYISLESSDLRSEASVFRARHISAPVLTEEDVDISFFRRFNFRGLTKAIFTSLRSFF
jgi:hypothetical protein